VEADDGMARLVIGVSIFSSSLMTSERRSAPIITLSLASSNSACVTMRLLRRAAVSAAR